MMESVFLTALGSFMNSLSFVVGSTFMFATVLLFAALGGLYSERSGVINIGLEGLMTFGAFCGATVAYYTGSPWWGFFFGGVGAMLLSVLHAIACVRFSAQQVVSGVAINFLGVGLSVFFARLLFNSGNTPPLLDRKLPVLFTHTFKDLPILENIFRQSIVFYLALLLVFFTWVFFYKTVWGFRLRAAGDAPEAVHALGVSVPLQRYIGVLSSGFLAGLGGATLSLALSTRFTPSLISGQGFIAIVAVIFGRWHPFGVFWACCAFGFFSALEIFLRGVDIVNVPTPVISMIPYLLVITTLAFLGGMPPPKGLGRAFVG